MLTLPVCRVPLLPHLQCCGPCGNTSWPLAVAPVSRNTPLVLPPSASHLACIKIKSSDRILFLIISIIFMATTITPVESDLQSIIFFLRNSYSQVAVVSKQPILIQKVLLSPNSTAGRLASHIDSVMVQLADCDC